MEDLPSPSQTTWSLEFSPATGYARPFIELSAELRIRDRCAWAQERPDRRMQDKADALWRLVLARHRAAWEAEAKSLEIKWSDPTSPLHEMCRRLQADADDE